MEVSTIKGSRLFIIRRSSSSHYFVRSGAIGGLLCPYQRVTMKALATMLNMQPSAIRGLF